MTTPEAAAEAIIALTGDAVREINELNRNVFTTRGGRKGSGMGLLLEALWGYYINRELLGEKGDIANCEIAWLSDHEYNDFACVVRDAEWDPGTRVGELLRIEAKSMGTDVDESKGHFDEPMKNLGPHDLLLVIVWSWARVDEHRLYPRIDEAFVERSRSVAELRDALHVARGGRFIEAGVCPDGCAVDTCPHDGEPINASGIRERSKGPDACMGANVSFAANFGGLVRMLKTKTPEARAVFRRCRRDSDVAHEYISFIHRNFPKEEANQYLAAEWSELCRRLGMSVARKKQPELIAQAREHPDYRDKLRELKRP